MDKQNHSEQASRVSREVSSVEIGEFEGIPQAISVERPVEDVLFEPIPINYDTSNITKVYVANEIGPCGGVQAAVEGAKIVAKRAQAEGTPVNVNARITNGADSNRQLTDVGLRMNVSPDQAEPASIEIIGAHGNTRDIKRSKELGLSVVDLTCIYVDATHKEVETVAKRVQEDGIPTGVIFLSINGRSDHAEFLGSTQHMEDLGVPYIAVHNQDDADALTDPDDARYLGATNWQRIRIVSQTTNDDKQAMATAEGIAAGIIEWDLPIDTSTFPYNGADVCRTVTQRQDAVVEMVTMNNIENLVVLGSVNSNNTRSLVDVAVSAAELSFKDSQAVALKKIILANSHLDIPPGIEGSVGIVSGASSDQQNVDWSVSMLAEHNDFTLVGESDKVRLGVFRLVKRGKSAEDQAVQIELSDRIREVVNGAETRN